MKVDSVRHSAVLGIVFWQHLCGNSQLMRRQTCVCVCVRVLTGVASEVVWFPSQMVGCSRVRSEYSRRPHRGFALNQRLSALQIARPFLLRVIGRFQLAAVSRDVTLRPSVTQNTAAGVLMIQMWNCGAAMLLLATVTSSRRQLFRAEERVCVCVCFMWTKKWSFRCFKCAVSEQRLNFHIPTPFKIK